MARRKTGRALSGILWLDKPAGMTSNAALQKVRHCYNAQKAGHGGTLDPFATGLLPILLGEATKFGQYFLNADKRYQVEVCFGSETSTDDSTGEVLYDAPIPDLQTIDWKVVLSDFQGEIEQIPPIFSALKVAGKRAYELARQGKLLQLQARAVRIEAIEVLSIGQHSVMLDVRCSKGTYIRALARDIGRALGIYAHAASLKRVGVGDKEICHAHDLQSIMDNPQRDAYLEPLTSALGAMAQLVLPADRARFVRHGNDIALIADEGEYALFEGETLLGVGVVKAGRLYPKRLISFS